MKKLVRSAVSATFVLGGGQIVSASSHQICGYELHDSCSDVFCDLLSVVQGGGEA